MIKATAKTANGRDLLVIGLTFANLDRFRRQAGDTYIRIDGAAMGLPVDVVIFSGETEEVMADLMTKNELIGPETQVTVSDRKKN